MPPIPFELLQKCTKKERAFILILVANPGMSQREAYLTAGFKASSRDSADANASKCLRKARVSEALGVMRRQALKRDVEKTELSANRVLEEIRRIAFYDLAGVFDDIGNVKPISQWTVEQRAALASFEVIVRHANGCNDCQTETIHKIRMLSKIKALQLLMKHFNLLDIRTPNDSENWEKWSARLVSARNRSVHD